MVLFPMVVVLKLFSLSFELICMLGVLEKNDEFLEENEIPFPSNPKPRLVRGVVGITDNC